MTSSPSFSELPSNFEQLSISSTEESHCALASYIDKLLTRPLRHRPFRRLKPPPEGTANLVYEIEDYLKGRTVLDPSKTIHFGCLNSKCLTASAKDPFASGLRYYCLDCTTTVLFCTHCVGLPGQGIDHDSTHRLLEIVPTRCGICQGLEPLDWHSGDSFRGPYKEYSASGSTLKWVAESRACGFCAFVWTALVQRPPDGLNWPPNENEEVKIRIRRLWSMWLEIAVVSVTTKKEATVEYGGHEFILETQKVHDQEKALQVGLLREWSHEAPVNPLSREEPDFKPNGPTKVQPDSGSDEALQLAKKWLDNCRQRHTACREPVSPVLPTRVLDIHCEDRNRVYLCEPKGKRNEYAALSYCWGPGAPGLITTANNFTSHRDDGIAIESLPKTIQDAIHAARRLDLRYLWVDRLCIIQDSVEDWLHEAALMCQVFSNTTITLSADGSSSAIQGLFQTNQAISQVVYHEYTDPDGNLAPLVLTEPLPHPNVNVRCLGLSQPLDSRGWTMQERLSSRRVLHFTSDEMAWECNTLTECECRRESHLSRRELREENFHNAQAIYDHWCSIVREYTKRSLSYESDKMPALQGLVQRFRQLLDTKSAHGDEQPDDFLAGLWRGDLVAQLAWKTPSEADLSDYLRATQRGSIDNVGKVDSNDALTWLAVVREREKNDTWRDSGTYVAPTWSWAHLRGPISYLQSSSGKPFVPYLDVMDAQTTLMSSKGPTSKLSSAYITLYGHIVGGLELNSFSGGFGDGSIKDFCFLGVEKHGFRWYIFFKPDDIVGLKKRHGDLLSNVVILLLGTRDVLTYGTTAVIVGMSTPPILPMSVRRVKEHTGGGMLGVGHGGLPVAGPRPQEPRRRHGHDDGISAASARSETQDTCFSSTETVVATGLHSPGVLPTEPNVPDVSSDSKKQEDDVENSFNFNSLPQELLEAFSHAGHRLRFSSYLVLVESTEEGQYERIGCFDVGHSKDILVMKTLFCHSEKDYITII